MTARELALKTLFEVEKNGAYTGIELKKQFGAVKLSSEDRAFATELVYGTVKNRTRLDFIISKYSSQKLKKLSVWILNILRLGVYQIVFLDKIPHSAAVNESVKLAKRYGHHASAGFVNGVLRSVSRSGDVEYPKGREYYEVYFSHPKPLVEMLFEQYGEKAAKIIENNNRTAAVTVRVNTLKATEKDALATLLDVGIKAEATNEPNVLKISGYGDISSVQAYKDGLITPQGLSSYKAAKALEPKSGDVILDLCAAPGGKTTAIAELSGDSAEIFAFDLFEHKIELINKNCERLGIKSVTAKAADATVFMPQLESSADRVIADVPCSGLGIIRKKPDIKWNRDEQSFDAIIKIQSKIFENAARYLKTGGIMVYSTCTINKNENEKVVQRLAGQCGLKVLGSETFLPCEEYDGFYICKMIKE